jgi:membrane protease YdiL (CAAX protease family)
MATVALAQPEPKQFLRIAAPLHTVLILCVEGFSAYRGKIRTDVIRDAVNLDRVHMYERTILFEWLVLALVIAGVWLHGSPLSAVLGERWRSARQVFLDFGIGLAFLVFSLMILSISSARSKAPDQATAFLLPHGRLEVALWMVMSLTAGICEEGLFRGYLQRQFMALTNSAVLGIVLSAAAFGAAHAYQGCGHALNISVLGLMLSALAHWRKSVRPGMISHAAQDMLALLVNH